MNHIIGSSNYDRIASLAAADSTEHMLLKGASYRR